jgi:hypothetical protein
MTQPTSSRRSAAAVVELVAHSAARAGRKTDVAARERLQLRLLIGADHEFVGPQPPTLETPGIEIEPPASLGAKVGGRARTTRSAAAKRLIASSASQRQIVDADASVTPRSMTNRYSVREKRPSGRPVRGRQLARDRLDLGELLRGKNDAGDPRAAYP